MTRGLFALSRFNTTSNGSSITGANEDGGAGFGRSCAPALVAISKEAAAASTKTIPINKLVRTLVGMMLLSLEGLKMLIQIAGRAWGLVSNYGGLASQYHTPCEYRRNRKVCGVLILNDSVVEIRRSTKLHEIPHEMFSGISCAFVDRSSFFRLDTKSYLRTRE
jgi:hypothetical protein